MNTLLIHLYSVSDIDVPATLVIGTVLAAVAATTIPFPQQMANKRINKSTTIQQYRTMQSLEPAPKTNRFCQSRGQGGALANTCLETQEVRTTSC